MFRSNQMIHHRLDKRHDLRGSACRGGEAAGRTCTSPSMRVATDDSKQPTVSGSSVGCGTYRIALRHQLSRRGPLRRRADGDQDPDNDGPQGDGREARFLRNRWRASYRWQEYLHLNPHQCSKETRTCRTATATTKAFTGQPQVTAVMMSDDYRSPLY